MNFQCHLASHAPSFICAERKAAYEGPRNFYIEKPFFAVSINSLRFA